MRLPRRPAAFGALLVLAAVALFALPTFCRSLAPVPSLEETQAIVFGNDLLAYSPSGEQPMVVFRDGGRVMLDRLTRGSIAIEFPPRPQWQLTGRWYSIPATSGIASVGVVVCGASCSTPTTLFGELNSAIAAVAVYYDGSWKSFGVEGLGYLVQLPGFHGVPDAYQWLDGSGVAVWTSGRVDPLTY